MNKAATYAALLVAGTCWSWNCAAHDFWLQPTSFWIHPNTATSLTLQVGHGPYRQRSPIPATRIIRFDAIGPRGSVLDLRTRLHPGSGPEDGNFELEEPKTHLLVLETDNKAQSHLPAIRFSGGRRGGGRAPAGRRRGGAGRAD